MKANGKNLKMYLFSTQHYMDMYPEYRLQTSTDENIKEFINHMRETWNSGIISYPKELTPEEYFQQRQSKYWKGYEASIDNLVLDCSQEYVDEYFKLVDTNN